MPPLFGGLRVKGLGFTGFRVSKLQGLCRVHRVYGLMLEGFKEVGVFPGAVTGTAHEWGLSTF